MRMLYGDRKGVRSTVAKNAGYLDVEPEDATATAAVRAALAKRGTPIGPYDAIIAGTALHRGLVMVTSNGGELAQIDGLILEDWRASENG